MARANYFHRWDFRIIAAWEDGVEFILDFKGTNADGYTMNYWEHNTFLFNDDGLIWRWDEVADTLGVDMGLRKGWGQRDERIAIP